MISNLAPAGVPAADGGNCDIKNLSRGCKVYLPVFVEGANLSLGDMHFSQVGLSHDNFTLSDGFTLSDDSTLQDGFTLA